MRSNRKGEVISNLSRKWKTMLISSLDFSYRQIKALQEKELFWSTRPTAVPAGSNHYFHTDCPYVRPKTSKSSYNHCRPGLWVGRVDHWWHLHCWSTRPTLSHSRGIIVFAHVVRPSPLFKSRKKQQKTMFATGVTIWVLPSGSLMTPVLSKLVFFPLCP